MIARWSPRRSAVVNAVVSAVLGTSAAFLFFVDAVPTWTSLLLMAAFGLHAVMTFALRRRMVDEERANRPRMRRVPRGSRGGNDELPDLDTHRFWDRVYGLAVTQQLTAPFDATFSPEDRRRRALMQAERVIERNRPDSRALPFSAQQADRRQMVAIMRDLRDLAVEEGELAAIRARLFTEAPVLMTPEIEEEMRKAVAREEKEPTTFVDALEVDDERVKEE